MVSDLTRGLRSVSLPSYRARSAEIEGPIEGGRGRGRGLGAEGKRGLGRRTVTKGRSVRGERSMAEEGLSERGRRVFRFSPPWICLNNCGISGRQLLAPVHAEEMWRTVSSPATWFNPFVACSIPLTILLLSRKSLRHGFFVVQNLIRSSAADIVLKV